MVEMSKASLPQRTTPAAEPAGLSWSVVVLKNRALGVLLFEVLIIAIFSLTADKFFSLSNLNTIFLNACIMAILASAEAVVIITRNYDVSIASILALSSYVGFDIIRTYPEFGPLLILVPLGIGLGCGLINGLLVAYGRVSSIFVTLAGLSVYRGLATLYAHGQQIEPKDIPSWVRDVVTGTLVPGISNLALIATAIVAAVSVYLRYTRMGRQIYAIGSNPGASVFYGLNVPRIILGAYALCGVLTGLSGFLFAARSSYVVPWSGQGLEINVIGAVVVGGVSVLGGSGNVVGASFGALVLATLDNGLILVQANEVVRELVYGMAIVGACILDASVLRRVDSLLKAKKRRGVAR
jgi:rhamnose transport system permease protein